MYFLFFPLKPLPRAHTQTHSCTHKHFINRFLLFITICVSDLRLLTYSYHSSQQFLLPCASDCCNLIFFRVYNFIRHTFGIWSVPYKVSIILPCPSNESLILTWIFQLSLRVTIHLHVRIINSHQDIFRTNEILYLPQNLFTVNH